MPNTGRDRPLLGQLVIRVHFQNRSGFDKLAGIGARGRLRHAPIEFPMIPLCHEHQPPSAEGESPIAGRRNETCEVRLSITFQLELGGIGERGKIIPPTRPSGAASAVH